MSNTSLHINQVQTLNSFQALASTPFQDEKNAMVWERDLKGDFSEIVESIELKENIAEIDLNQLREIKLSKQGNIAREVLLNDMKLLKEHGASPVLNLIKQYDRDDSYPFFPTDVYSFHVDRSPIPTATFLCTYFGASSDILPNHQADHKILVPEIRNELKNLYGGKDEKGFDEFLKEYFFDLHYQPKANANLINCGIGNLWKLAVDHPESKVLPCLHRAPLEKLGETRLMLIC